MSPAIATTIFRTFSACSCSRVLNSIRSSLVSPSTILATSSPKSSSISATVTSVSSTVSCRSAAVIVVVSRCRSARIVATATGCRMKSSPEIRFWPSWDTSATAYARWISLRSALGL